MSNLSKMEAEFAKARKKAMQQVEEYVSSLFQNEETTVKFRFDAYQLWGKSEAKEVFQFLKEQELYLDDWARGVLPLSKEQAIKLAKLVEDWNDPWEYEIARKQDGDPSEYYNAYPIHFMLATGAERQIKVGTGGIYTSDSWQWS